MTRGTDCVIWSIEHQAWWRAGEMGYTETLSEAGRYSADRAAAIVARANTVAFHECAIPVWAFRIQVPVSADEA